MSVTYNLTIIVNKDVNLLKSLKNQLSPKLTYCDLVGNSLYIRPFDYDGRDYGKYLEEKLKNERTNGSVVIWQIDGMFHVDLPQIELEGTLCPEGNITIDFYKLLNPKLFGQSIEEDAEPQKRCNNCNILAENTNEVCEVCGIDAGYSKE